MFPMFAFWSRTEFQHARSRDWRRRYKMSGTLASALSVSESQMRSVKLAFCNASRVLLHITFLCSAKVLDFRGHWPLLSTTRVHCFVKVNETILKSMVTYPDQDYFYQTDYSLLVASIGNILSSSCRQVQQCPAPTTTPPPPREIQKSVYSTHRGFRVSAHWCDQRTPPDLFY